MTRVDQLKTVQAEALALFEKKNADYGDAFAKYGVIGVLMRMEDKLQRSLNISKTNIHLVENEGIRDTLLDLHNYAAMALMLLNEEPNVTNEVKATPVIKQEPKINEIKEEPKINEIVDSESENTIEKAVRKRCEYCKL